MQNGSRGAATNVRRSSGGAAVARVEDQRAGNVAGAGMVVEFSANRRGGEDLAPASVVPLPLFPDSLCNPLVRVEKYTKLDY